MRRWQPPDRVGRSGSRSRPSSPHRLRRRTNSSRLDTLPAPLDRRGVRVPSRAASYVRWHHLTGAQDAVCRPAEHRSAAISRPWADVGLPRSGPAGARPRRARSLARTARGGSDRSPERGARPSPGRAGRKTSDHTTSPRGRTMRVHVTPPNRTACRVPCRRRLDQTTAVWRSVPAPGETGRFDVPPEPSGQASDTERPTTGGTGAAATADV